MRPADLAETAECLCLASRRAARAITRSFDQALRPHGLRATQFSLLAALQLNGPLTVSALASLLELDRTTLTRNAAVAEALGFVESRAGFDARSRIVSITDHGRAILLRAYPAWRSVQTKLTQALGETASSGLRDLTAGLPRPAGGEI